MKNFIQRLISGAFGLGALLSLASCGQGQDPLFALGDPTYVGQGILSFPLSSPYTGNYFSIIPFQSKGNQWVIALGSSQAPVNVLAPANGLVTNISITNGNYSNSSITILHNARLSTQLSGVMSSGVTVGSYVVQGQLIGQVVPFMTVSSGVLGVPFAVLLDNNVVCPLSFLSAQARAQLAPALTTNLCPS